MHTWTFVIFLALGVLPVGLTQASDVIIQSGPSRTPLLELFTSEGCSSCPPAEEWLSTLVHSPKLWTQVVPVAFHINYWDDLGWPDRFATQAFTDRQRQYAASWNSENIYTPEFVLNGHEWRSRDWDAIPVSTEEPGILSATRRDTGEIKITFNPRPNSGAEWEAHAALLGLGVTSNVEAGENSGRKLVHDFVVLALQTAEMDGTTPTATVHFPAGLTTPEPKALAVWVTRKGNLEPIQATGGRL